MADKKISQLTSLAQGDIATTTDVLAIVDTSATETKKATPAAIVGAAAAAGLTSVDINSGAIDGTTIGANSAAAGTFTNLTASSTVSFSGATVSNGGSVTTVDINGGTIDGASVGASSASSGAFTTLSASGNVTLSGGTANGVLYLNGSKVATSGSALTFDGTNLGIGRTPSGYTLDITTGGNALRMERSGVEMGGFISGGNSYWGTITNDPFLFMTNSTERMRLTSTGLGIGTSSPGAKLEVTGSGTTPPAKFYTSGTSSAITSYSATPGLQLISYQSDTGPFTKTAAIIANADGTAPAPLQFWTKANGSSSPSLNATLDSSGNLGLGVTPSAWGSSYKALQQSGGVHYGVDGAGSDFYGIVGSNAYNNNSGWIYVESKAASLYRFGVGTHSWFTAPSGTAGNAISFTQAMTLDASGNLGLGVTPSAWGSGWGALQIKSGGMSLWSDGGDRSFINTNSYYNGTNRIYTTDGVALEYSQDSGGHAWKYAASGTAGNAISFTQAMTLDASGNLLVGKTSSTGVGTQNIEVSNASSSTVAIKGGSNEWSMLVSSSSDSLRFYEDSTERARITAGGTLLVAKTSEGAPATAGCEFSSTGGVFTRDSGDPLLVNRQTDDGTLVTFRQDNTTEGTISVSGNTVSYNAFAGSHWSQLQDGSKPDILRGTVMESINELCVWPGENNERLPKAKISDTAGSKKVYGVFMAWDNDWTETNDMYVTAVGAFICRVNGSVTVQEGDLLESNGDGTARVQADDIIRSSTIGKVTSTVKTHQYDDGSYCVPTVLYCG